MARKTSKRVWDCKVEKVLKITFPVTIPTSILKEDIVSLSNFDTWEMSRKDAWELAEEFVDDRLGERTFDGKPVRRVSLEDFKPGKLICQPRWLPE